MNRCVRKLFKELGRRIPEAEIREDLHINVHAVLQLRPKRRDQDAEKFRPLTSHFSLSAARVLYLAKVLSLTAVFDPCVKAETAELQMGRCVVNAASTSDTAGITAVMHLGVWPAGTSTRRGIVSPQSSGLRAASCGITTLQSSVVAVSRKRRRRLLQSDRKESAAECAVSPRA